MIDPDMKVPVVYADHTSAWGPTALPKEREVPAWSRVWKRPEGHPDVKRG
jgi:hypothetical protein